MAGGISGGNNFHKNPRDISISACISSECTVDHFPDTQNMGVLTKISSTTDEKDDCKIAF